MTLTVAAEDVAVADHEGCGGHRRNAAADQVNLGFA
jgi:hypothetical protein